jgi:hypothetical protein
MMPAASVSNWKRKSLINKELNRLAQYKANLFKKGFAFKYIFAKTLCLL